jgi:hypothetical protein
VLNAVSKWDEFTDPNNEQEEPMPDTFAFEDEMVMREQYDQAPVSYEPYQEDRDYGSFDEYDDDRLPHCNRCKHNYLNCGCEEFTP